MKKPIHVLAAQLVDPGLARISFDVDHGATVAEIVARAIKQGDIDLDRVRVTIVSDHGASLITPNLWDHVRPNAGMQVVIRTIPGRDSLRTVLLVVVSVAASTIAPQLGLPALQTALVQAGLTIVGGLLVNALIPVLPNDPGKVRDVFAIQGWRNDVRAGEVIPMAFGRMRYAPPFAATSYTEIVGDEHYVRALFTFGYGPLAISDLRIGDTAIDDFDGIDVEVREGRGGDAPVSLYPRQVIEDNEGVQLTRPLPRDAYGEVIKDGVAVETPVVRYTASDAAEASVILNFPSGLFRINSDNEYRIQGVTVRIRARLEGVGPWSDVVTLEIKQDKRESFYRQHTWTLPTRGRWQIEVTRMTYENVETDEQDQVHLAAIQSIRPEYPINIGTPIAMVAIRAKASQQANGVLNTFNALIERETLIYNGADWVTGYNRTPAAAYVSALQAPSNAFPVSDAEIDWDLLAEWHEWCVLKGLKYDRVHDQAESLETVLMAICGAGRAAPRHDGLKWGVVVDWQQELVVDHINPRNSDEFTWTRNYFDPPHAFRVAFLDETNEHTPAERLVPWPGHVGEITLVEELALPGKTDPDEIWVEARRQMYVLEHRADTFTAMQSGRARVVTRGDLVAASTDVLQRTQAAALVTAIKGNLVVLDELVDVPDGYAVRFKRFANDADEIGTSTVREIAANDGPSTAVRLTGSGAVPTVGSIVHIGPIATESFALRVRGIEGAQDHDARLIMVAAAPEIEVLTDAETPPAWNGRVGAEISVAALAPAAPRFARVATGQIGTGSPDGLEVLVAPGAGSTATVTSFEIDHRADGATTWNTITVAAATGAADVTAYAADAVVELRARAIASGIGGAYTAILTVTIGADDPTIPGALDDAAIDVLGSLGRAIVGVGIPPDAAIAQLQIYRSPEGVSLDRAAHAVRDPFAVEPSSTASFTDGDATRTNQIVGGGFADANDWTLGTGWAVSGGAANHAPGMAGDLSNDMTFVEGATYRIAFTVSGGTAGNITPKLTGGGAVSGAAIAVNGLVQITLTAGAENTAFTLAADSQFDGSIDDVIIYRETATSVAAGRWSYWVEPQNNLGVAGPVSGPFPVTIF